MVAGVNDGGPADKAQIHNGDVILKFNNQDVKDMHALPRIVADSEVGQSVPVLLWRDGKEVTVQAKLAEKPDDTQQAAATTEVPVDQAAIAGQHLRPWASSWRRCRRR